MYSLKSTDERNNAIDILKILSMVMVVLLHLRQYGIYKAEVELHTPIYWMALLVRSFSVVAVNCFVLISGYFLCDQVVKKRKLLSQWIQVEMYSVGIYLVLCIIPKAEVAFSAKTLVRQMLPILTDQYWFFTCYILLMLLVPFLNKFINALSQAEFQKCLALLLVLFSVIPTINVFGDSFGINGGYSLLWFIVLYCIAAYVRRYPLKNRKYGLGYLLCCMALVVLNGLCDYFAVKIPAINVLPNLAFTYNSVFVLFASVCLFEKAVQTRWHITNKTVGKMISRIARLSFGVYLLHENSQIRDILWDKWIRLSEYTNDFSIFIIRAIGAVCVIFMAGILLEWIREVGISKVVVEYKVKKREEKGTDKKRY